MQQHQETESNLRSTRNELIQAAKLAVLGQMSAGINHELNQPLSAIRSYTENAEEFLKRNRPEMAVRNMQEVIQLTDHMTEIIRQLKAFARKYLSLFTPPAPLTRAWTWGCRSLVTSLIPSVA